MERTSSLFKQLLLVFLSVAVLYLAVFYFIESLRARRGPWLVTFLTDSNGLPRVGVANDRLALSNIVFTFPGTNLAAKDFHQKLVFDQPITNAPFGRIIFLDTTFLPGTLTMDLFGHEIELLPRTLVIDKQEHPWCSDVELPLPAR